MVLKKKRVKKNNIIYCNLFYASIISVNIVSHLIFTTRLWGRYDYRHFTHNKTKTQSSGKELIFPSSQASEW